jgi:hypothetical protein
MVGTIVLALVTCFQQELTFYSFGYHSTCWNYHFPIPYGITSYMGHISLGCPLLGTTLWNLIVYSYLQLQVSLVDHLHEQEIASLLVDILLDIMQAHLHSCAILRANVWLLTHPTTFAFCLSSTNFIIILCTCFGLPHPMVKYLSWCQYDHTINNLGIHLFRCPCGNEHIIVHDTFQHTITTIVLESKTLVQKEVFHLFPCHTQWQMDVFLTKNNF